MMSAKEAEKRHLKPMAKIVSHAITGVKPQIMGIGPISAVRKAVSISTYFFLVKKFSCEVVFEKDYIYILKGRKGWLES